MPAPPGRDYRAAALERLPRLTHGCRYRWGLRRRQPASPESGGPGPAGRAAIRGQAEAVCSQRTPRDQDAPGCEVVGPEGRVAVDLRGRPGAVSGVQFPAAKGGVSSVSWSKQPASKFCAVQTQPGNVP